MNQYNIDININQYKTDVNMYHSERVYRNPLTEFTDVRYDDKIMDFQSWHWLFNAMKRALAIGIQEYDSLATARVCVRV
ncbi:MAG: hypothetical protein A3I77_06780 [Gammaproteobacteria bacterium RIFCSPLOWO2_02_FULL_42_14]|nr:MAG: hypothetical protein A3B71_02615 [Gammaproteobacteria bacterium RIFCSPHIGHO2_02_FULL_42_43]OGT28001.1 MAG: hypothetical protein A2624_03930 [Gammaproteobacteria bacterium RIFCSPHIGHO2_01_FULL_42_8]OGT51965.1 MAG: hypothetical protein A3E54_04120 [Gammaproteobacteria bacterium RIFCSPHIGHO2_12_FULL_41_25]OGT61070.1 MAG: hypothetical protein A3I77_06780 [Gammaproteobacteria bacterium RIFCSPLOWO2_02_FULL_42_14]OGT86998.1 MAG: hypothetical protein A3G86_00500 [Gammaproteobacteria bacterium R